MKVFYYSSLVVGIVFAILSSFVYLTPFLDGDFLAAKTVVGVYRYARGGAKTQSQAPIVGADGES